MLKYFTLTDHYGFEFSYMYMHNAVKSIMDDIERQCRDHKCHATHACTSEKVKETGSTKVTTWTYKACYTNGMEEEWTLVLYEIKTFD